MSRKLCSLDSSQKRTEFLAGFRTCTLECDGVPIDYSERRPEVVAAVIFYAKLTPLIRDTLPKWLLQFVLYDMILFLNISKISFSVPHPS